MIEKLLKYICSQLETNQIEYMLSGSLAMNIYATPRMTRDADIVINLRKEDTDKFLGIFSENYYFNKKSIIEEIERKGMFNIIDNISGYKLDFIIKKNSAFREAEFKRKKYQNIFDFKAWIVSSEDLIISKLIWTQKYVSNQQLNDIKNLTRSTNIDKEYILSWCKKLKISTFDLL